MFFEIQLAFFPSAAAPSVCTGTAILVAASLGVRWAISQEALPPARVGIWVCLVALATLAGGRLHFVLANWPLYTGQPLRAFSPFLGALHAPGALVAAVLGGAVIARWLALSASRLIDAFAPAAAIGTALARVGCFLHGCCFGKVSALPWAVTFSRGTFIYNYQVRFEHLSPTAAHSWPIHPLPLYYAAAALAITVGLLWYRCRRRYAGELGVCFLLLFSASSAALEPLRAHTGQYQYWGPLPQLQWITLAMTISAGLLLAIAERRHRRATFSPAAQQ